MRWDFWRDTREPVKVRYEGSGGGRLRDAGRGVARWLGSRSGVLLILAMACVMDRVLLAWGISIVDGHLYRDVVIATLVHLALERCEVSTHS